jgi:hypothetical protein
MGSGLGVCYDVYEGVSFAVFFEVKRRSVDLDLGRCLGYEYEVHARWS